MRLCFFLVLSLISLGAPTVLGQGSTQPDQAPIEEALPQPPPKSLS
jgi:hypothetical protein